jgi:hypothetical protein
LCVDIEFDGLIGESVVVYIDDVNIYSKQRSDHAHYLKKIFKWCRKYDISLNPKKSIFVVSKGKLLGHIISKEVIFVYIERTKSIMKIHFPNIKKSI